jgi:hypothetical protein
MAFMALHSFDLLEGSAHGDIRSPEFPGRDDSSDIAMPTKNGSLLLGLSVGI